MRYERTSGRTLQRLGAELRNKTRIRLQIRLAKKQKIVCYRMCNSRLHRYSTQQPFLLVSFVRTCSIVRIDVAYIPRYDHLRQHTSCEPGEG
jgi:hypothetical protein